jgi:hypothetical protein
MLPTRYELKGSKLVQYVDLRDAAFPVVADPRISFGWYIYVRYSKGEVKDFASQVPYLGAFGLIGIWCARIPNVWLASACGVSAIIYAGAIANTFTAAGSENKCVEIKFDWDGFIAGWKRYSC